MLNLAHLNNKFLFILEPIATSLKFATEFIDGMIKEGEKLSKIAKNIVIKLPLTKDGLKASNFFYTKKISTNVTLCFSPAQALIAAKSHASYISPFVGRLDDIGENGMDLIKKIKAISLNICRLLLEVSSLGVRATVSRVPARI